MFRDRGETHRLRKHATVQRADGASEHEHRREWLAVVTVDRELVFEAGNGRSA